MLTIMINGRPLDPKRAARELRPLDSFLICPACNGGHVQAKDALTIEQFGKGSDIEHADLVPRLQDRNCLDCGLRWSSVLPPRAYTP